LRYTRRRYGGLSGCPNAKRRHFSSPNAYVALAIPRLDDGSLDKVIVTKMLDGIERFVTATTPHPPTRGAELASVDPKNSAAKWALSVHVWDTS